MELNEYTFSTIFGKHTNQDNEVYEIEQIEIPIVQRDYAQGRSMDKVKRIRTRFLNTLYDSLTQNKRLTLDFVYGEIQGKKLIPLDGQQRLTTLFLLHWYLARKEYRQQSEFAFLSKFTYFTRPSSRDFCSELVQYIPPFNNAVISDDIKNQAWFQYQWSNDPTINGMLVMIDAIHDKFFKAPLLWSALVENPCISFYFLPIAEMGLSDELYIKMNSRGKPLTDFEHFKAEFEGMVKQYDDALSDEINRKFDIEWTDMLFPYRGENNIIDDEFMRYYFYISDILCYIQGIPLEKDEFVLCKKLYSKENASYKENIDFLINSFDCWCGIKDIEQFFSTHFSSHQYETNKTKIYQEEINLFRQCCETYGEYEGRNRKFSLSMMLLLYAIIIYLQNQQDISDSDFRRRIRIVRNLIWNSQYEIRADGHRNNMPQLLSETKNIIITGIIPEGTGYNQKQKEEEREKLVWLENNITEQDRLFHLEDQSLLYGCISVVGLSNVRNFDKFRELFAISDRNLIHRALLTCGNYTQQQKNSLRPLYFMGNGNDSTWKDLFHPTDKRDGFCETSKIINTLLDKLTNPCELELNTVISDYLNMNRNTYDWMYYFVKYPDMLKGNEGVFMLNKYPYDWYALHHSTLRGHNWQALAIAAYVSAKDKLVLGNWAYNKYEPLQTKSGIQIIVTNGGFELYNPSTQESKSILIPNEEGIDTVNRIDYLLEQI